MKYRRIVIIFMLVVLNVLVTKSKHALLEEDVVDDFVKDCTSKLFQIRYGMGIDHYKNGLHSIQKIESKKYRFTHLLDFGSQNKNYDQAIMSMMFALNVLLESADVFTDMGRRVKEDKDPERKWMISQFGFVAHQTLHKAKSVSELVHYLIKQRKNLRSVDYYTLCQRFIKLKKDMEKYDKRIESLFEEHSVSTAG